VRPLFDILTCFSDFQLYLYLCGYYTTVTIKVKEELMNETITKRPNAYAYIRWSTDDQGETGRDSERRQIQYADNIIKRRHLNFAGVFKDDGKSAYKGENLKPWSEFSRLKKIVKEGDYILVENTDRITRRGLGVLLRELSILTEEKKAIVICNNIELTEKNYDKDLNILVQGKIANDESIKKSERITSAWYGKKKSIGTGQFTKLNFPPIWLKNGENEYIEIPERVEVIQRIFNLSANGMSCSSITALLNQEQVPPFNRNKNPNAKWNPANVYNLLHNKAVIGYLPKSYSGIQNEMKIFKPIVDEELFYKVQKTCTERRKTFVGRQGSQINLFTGLCKCSKCGRSLVRHGTGKRGHKHYYVYLCCIGSMNDGSCDGVGIKEVELIKSLSSVMETCEEPIRKLAKEKSEPVNVSNLEKYEKELGEVRIQIQKLTDIIIDNQSPPTMVVNKLRDFEVIEKKLLENIDKETVQLKGTIPIDEYIVQIKTEEFKKMWNDESKKLELREILRGMIEKIVVDREHRTYDIFFKGVSKPLHVANISK
jgi:DNA invertase Pin-like site-specific DNA recombinase